VPAQGLEKWLKAPVDHAAQRGTIDFDLADSRCAFDLLGGGRAHETHFDSLHWKLSCHFLRLWSRRSRDIRGITDPVPNRTMP